MVKGKYVVGIKVNEIVRIFDSLLQNAYLRETINNPFFKKKRDYSVIPKKFSFFLDFDYSKKTLLNSACNDVQSYLMHNVPTQGMKIFMSYLNIKCFFNSFFQ